MSMQLTLWADNSAISQNLHEHLNQKGFEVEYIQNFSTVPVAKYQNVIWIGLGEIQSRFFIHRNKNKTHSV